jgi:hypothetical protein
MYELINSESGVGDDPSECTLSDLPVVGHDNTSIRVAAAQDHMAAGLAAELEAGAF